MIRLKSIKGRTCPFFACDQCGLDILDYRDAHALWDDDNKLQHVHKKCDLRTFPYWCPLSEHVYNLAWNSGLKPDEFADVAEEMKSLQELL